MKDMYIYKGFLFISMAAFTSPSRFQKRNEKGKKIVERKVMIKDVVVGSSPSDMDTRRVENECR